ncbi:MAG TPA: hypothetical protein PKC80_01305 [Burkholderiaceae bacterium]|nr:hypothetical protein [Burkholderiaceae bacterium]
MSRPTIYVEDDRIVEPFGDEVPEIIQASVAEYYYPGCWLMRCPRLSKKGGWFFFASRRVIIIEWWLFDADGELIEVFWDEEDFREVDD